MAVSTCGVPSSEPSSTTITLVRVPTGPLSASAAVTVRPTTRSSLRHGTTIQKVSGSFPLGVAASRRRRRLAPAESRVVNTTRPRLYAGHTASSAMPTRRIAVIVYAVLR